MGLLRTPSRGAGIQKLKPECPLNPYRKVKLEHA